MPDSPERPPFGRPILDILTDLRRDIPRPLIKQKTQGGSRIDFIEWHTACRLLDGYAPGWEGRVTKVEHIGEAVVVTYAITVHAAEGSFTREATGNEAVQVKGYGDPFSNAEAMAMKRAAAKWGVGVGLYEK